MQVKYEFDNDSDPIENLKVVLDTYDNIGAWISGGADSALGLYIMQLYNTNTKILIIHGFDTSRFYEGQSFHSDMATENVVNKVKELLPEKAHLIEDMYVFEYFKREGETKGQYNRPHEDKLKSDGRIQMTVSFLTANPPFKMHPQQEPKRDDHGATHHAPFARIDKKWIAQKYKEHDLLESLFPLTVSCTSARDEPCRQCFWCKEKYWAFGVYDGGSPQLR